ncbi:hypothetical protein ACTXT7_015613 [Hymenolepis weldensis]
MSLDIDEFGLIPRKNELLLKKRYFRELCQTDVYRRIFRMIKASNKITLEGIINESINLESGLNQQKFGVDSSASRIFAKEY